MSTDNCPAGTCGGMGGTVTVTTSGDSGDGGILGFFAGIAAGLTVLAKAVAGWIEGGGADSNYGSTPGGPYSPILNPQFPLYPTLQPWENGLGNALLEGIFYTGPDPYGPDPVGQHGQGTAALASATSNEHSAGEEENAMLDPLERYLRHAISVKTGPGSHGDAFIIGYVELTPPIQGARPFGEFAVLAGATPEGGAYVSKLGLSGIQYGSTELYYDQAEGKETTYWLSGKPQLEEGFKQTEVNTGLITSGRYETSLGETGSYFTIGLEPTFGDSELTFGTIGVGVGLSDSALSVLIRPLAPVGAFRHAELGYDEYPPR